MLGIDWCLFDYYTNSIYLSLGLGNSCCVQLMFGLLFLLQVASSERSPSYAFFLFFFLFTCMYVMDKTCVSLMYLRCIFNPLFSSFLFFSNELKTHFERVIRDAFSRSSSPIMVIGDGCLATHVSNNGHWRCVFVIPHL